MTYKLQCICRTSTLPALFVFGKASIDVNTCVESLSHCLTTSNKPIMVRMDNLLCDCYSLFDYLLMANCDVDVVEKQPRTYL